MHDLTITGLTKTFGGLAATDNINMHIHYNEIVGLIGPNGAGKTTLFNMLTGIYSPTKGSIIYKGSIITGLKPYKIANLGVARTFQNIRLFPSVTVLQNILTGFHTRTNSSLFDSVFRTKKHRVEERDINKKAFEILKMVGLYTKADEYSKNLPYGEQRKLEIARALASSPGLILLDEPAAGMNESETVQLKKFILNLKDRGITVLLIEHDMKLVMNTCDRIYVLDHGNIIAEGPPRDIQNNPKVIEAYLGRGA